MNAIPCSCLRGTFSHLWHSHKYDEKLEVRLCFLKKTAMSVPMGCMADMYTLKNVAGFPSKLCNYPMGQQKNIVLRRDCKKTESTNFVLWRSTFITTTLHFLMLRPSFRNKDILLLDQWRKISLLLREAFLMFKCIPLPRNTSDAPGRNISNTWWVQNNSRPRAGVANIFNVLLDRRLESPENMPIADKIDKYRSFWVKSCPLQKSGGFFLEPSMFEQDIFRYVIGRKVGAFWGVNPFF